MRLRRERQRRQRELPYFQAGLPILFPKITVQDQFSGKRPRVHRPLGFYALGVDNLVARLPELQGFPHIGSGSVGHEDAYRSLYRQVPLVCLRDCVYGGADNRREAYHDPGDLWELQSTDVLDLIPVPLVRLPVIRKGAALWASPVRGALLYQAHPRRASRAILALLAKPELLARGCVG